MSLRSILSVLLVGASFGVATPLSAQTFTWDGGGADGNWSTAANWNPDGAPSDANPWDTFLFGGTSQLNSNNDMGGSFGAYNVNRIEFLAGAGAFTLTDNGDGFDMLGADSAAAADGLARITNSSTSTQTIDVNLLHRGDFNTGLVFEANSGDLVINGIISGSGSDIVRVNGGNNVTFAGANTFTNNLEVLGNTTLTLDGGSAVADTGRVYVGDNPAGGSTLALLADETVGSFGAHGNLALGSSTLTTMGITSLGASRSIYGDITGDASSGITKMGPAELRFQGGGDNSGFSGTIDVVEGQLRVDTGSDLNKFGNASAEIIVRSGATLLGVSSTNSTFNLGQITLDGGQLKGAGGNHNRFKSIDVTANGGTIGRTETSDSQVRTNALSGTGDLTILGPAGGNRNYWLVLQNTVDETAFTGDFTIDAARLIAETTGTGRINDGSNVNVINNGEFNIRGTEIIGSLSGDATALVQRGSGTGNIWLLAGADNTSTTFSGTMDDDPGAQLRFTKQGTGTLTLDGTNTATGNFEVDAGILQLDGGSAIADNVSTRLNGPGATLELLADETVGSFGAVASTTLALNDNTLTIAGLNDNRSIFGAVTGGTASGIVKNGTDQLYIRTTADLSGFSGTIDVVEGQLRVDTGSDLNKFGNADAEIIARAGATILGVSSTGSTFNVGQITLDGGQLKGAGGNHNRFKSIDVTANGGTIGREESFDSQVRTNALSGTGDLTVQGPAGGNRNYWLVLQNSVDQTAFTGDFLIDGGRLVANTSEMINDNSRVTVIEGGELNIRGTETIGSLSGAAGASVGRGSGTGNVHLLTGNDNTDTTFAGVISNDGGGGATATELELSKVGTGTMTLTGTNTYEGDTNVNGGILLVSAGGAITQTGNANIAAGATLQLLDGNVTTPGVFDIATGGALDLSGGGDLTAGNTNWGGSILDSTPVGDAFFSETDGTLASTATSTLDLLEIGNVFDLVGGLDLGAGGTLDGFDLIPVQWAAEANEIAPSIYELLLVDATGTIAGDFSSELFPGGALVDDGIGNLLLGGQYFVETRGNQLYLVANIPEPSRALLLLLGLVAGLARRRR